MQVLDKNNTVADTNQSKLGTEAARLSEFNARACNCWIWLVLLVVCCVFVSESRTQRLAASLKKTRSILLWIALDCSKGRETTTKVTNSSVSLGCKFPGASNKHPPKMRVFC